MKERGGHDKTLTRIKKGVTNEEMRGLFRLAVSGNFTPCMRQP